MPRSQADDRAVYVGVHHVLQWGMVISTVLYALGVVRSWPHPPRIPLHAPLALSLKDAAYGLTRMDAASLMWLATVLLILTPVARVVVAFIDFGRERDRRFMLVTGTVLAIIIFTVVLGRLGLH